MKELCFHTKFQNIGLVSVFVLSVRGGQVDYIFVEIKMAKLIEVIKLTC